MPVMSVYFKNNEELRPARFWMITTLFLGVLLSATPVHAENASTGIRHAGIIVLDPGHGGNDPGARGYENMIEKQITMAFAGLMAERLKKNHRVVLTRKDDYQIQLFERPALANHLKADLFVSLHTGASLRSFPRGMSLFYYNAPPGNAKTFEPQASAPNGSSRSIEPWERERPGQVEKSRYFTELIRKRLTQADKNLKLTTSGAPLLVLSGTDMPAVLIEIGYITNPLDAKALSDRTNLLTLAHAICDAIDDFFSSDLRL